VQEDSAAEGDIAFSGNLNINALNFAAKDDACVRIQSISNLHVSLKALIDTGSPVSLIRNSIYKRFFPNKERFKIVNNINLKDVNNSVISILGKVYDQISIPDIANSWFDVELFIVNDSTMQYDLLLDRQFFTNAHIKLIYHQGGFSFERGKNSDDFIHAILVMEIEKFDQYDQIKNNLDQEVPFFARKKLLKIFKSVDAKKIEPIQDDYSVKLHIKDESFFRFAPRKLSFTEKNELDAIINDLLERKIIKPSVSPYCSRAILVPKRNGQKRMCIDLKPLNQRVHPQKYPFPIIEDHLDKLHGKKFFTKLDLKDSFHQIKIHPEFTKYFAFATPSGQYEYLRLPFVFSEAPAEFQKRILHVFNDLIRENKLLIYIDDLLIASVNIEENLEILEKVLIRLREYGLELNLSKCSFLKKEIEYLGYLVSESGITLCKRHVQAVLEFPQPKSVKELQGFLGLCNYFRRFIQNFAVKTGPLQALLKKDVPFIFDNNCNTAFTLLKRELSSPLYYVYTG